MVTFQIKDYAPDCLNNDDGQKIYKLVAPYLEKQEQVEVSFAGIYSATSSFINSAFIALLDVCSFECIKRFLKITNSNVFINRLIKTRFSSVCGQSDKSTIH